MKYQIIDNLLSLEDFTKIKENIINNRFPWYFIDEVAYDGDPDKSLNSFLFSSTLYDNNVPVSDEVSLFNTVFKELNPISIQRVRVNCHTFSNKLHKYSYHIDVNHPSSLTAIFYLNTNDGLTFLEDLEVESVENRLLVFNSNILHCGTNTTNSKGRFLVNINFFPDINSRFYSLV